MAFEQELEEIRENLKGAKNKIIIISGKGGVGKTTIAVLLSYILAMRKYKVGLLDIDVHGPNVAKMLGEVDEPVVDGNNKIIPVEVNEDLKFLSMGLFLKESDPLIWRGPLKVKVIVQFLKDAVWGNLDFFIIDSPPGTGDEPLTVCQLVPDLTGAIIVTTPQEVAIQDVKRSISFVKQLNINIIGIVENMSGFICPYCGKEVALFKKDGGIRLSQELKTPFLGRIPFDPELIEILDKGILKGNFGSNLQSYRAFKHIVEKVEDFVKERKEVENIS
ncbi:MAG: Mrp/NBP35 family ATP-binding protein [Candidatus Omnitrophica bacterium]|nr:Mrp/NBP35 family ATP-binding protein [Candidatus Omnitrophota bacterium]